MDVLSIYQYTSWIQSAWDSACLMIQDFQQLTIAAVCRWEDHCTCSNTKNTARRRSQCNSLLSRLPMSTIQPLQHVMNAVARVIMNLSLRDHVKPALMQLHWLPVEQRISVELAVRQPPVDRPLCHHTTGCVSHSLQTSALLFEAPQLLSLLYLHARPSTAASGRTLA